MQSGTYHRKLRVVEDDRSKGLAVVDMHDSPTPASANEPLDGGRRRYLCLEADFDTRAVWLDMKIEDSWDEEVKALWRDGKIKIREGFAQEFGEWNLEQKIARFIEIGAKPFSILSHHNALFDQVRRAYVIGSYYAALTGASALGERILNHLALDFASGTAIPLNIKGTDKGIVHGLGSANWSTRRVGRAHAGA
jgi:hypothetical protein